MTRRDSDLTLDLTLDLTHARNLALDLAYTLDPTLDPDPDPDLARALILARVRALDGTRDHNLDREHARALDLARTLDRTLALALDPDLNRTIAIALDRDLNRTIALDLDLNLNRALALDRDLNLTLDRALDLHLQRARVHVKSIAEQSRQLVMAVERCHNRARQMLGEQGVNASGAVPRLNPVACRVIGQALRVVPVAHRYRYDEEFRGDLAEIAHAGRGAQVRFALRVLGRVWVLRTALRGVPPEAPERVGPG